MCFVHYLLAKTASSPFAAWIILTEKGIPLEDPNCYRMLIGKLLYLGLTGPDISHVTQQLSQYPQEPHNHHLQAALHVLRYLKRTLGLGLFYSANSTLKLQGHYDLDWATCRISRKSLTRYCIQLGNSLISWESKKQSIVSKFTAEAEYRSMSTTTCELRWISYLLTDLHVSTILPIPLYCDNEAAIPITKNPVL